MSSLLLGIPLVGKLFVPTMTIGAALLAFVVILSWYKQKGVTTITPDEEINVKPIETLGSEGPDLADIQAKFKENAEKKKKKKKSCCGTKGSCCKTKKDKGEEKEGGSCGCGCGTNKQKGDENECSSDESSSAGDDEVPQVLDVEELGRIAEGLRPDLVPISSVSPTIPKRGRVRLHGSEVKLSGSVC